jgi:N-acetylmuramoyl-L-alanine amidase
MRSKTKAFKINSDKANSDKINPYNRNPRRNKAKLIFLFISTLIYFSSFAKNVFAESNQHKFLVVIDAGHGGEDSGASLLSIKEKDIALKVALALQSLLKKDHDFKTIMTRNRDTFIPLDRRREIAEKESADIFISIHANSSPTESARGTEFYFENQAATDEESQYLANRENSETISLSKDVAGTKTENPDVNHILNDLTRNEHIQASKDLAQAMLDAFKKDLKVKTRAIRQAPFRVLGTGMPATLIELGFISNHEEAEWLNHPKTQITAAHAILDGLKDFKNKLDRTNRKDSQEF